MTDSIEELIGGEVESPVIESTGEEVSETGRTGPDFAIGKMFSIADEERFQSADKNKTENDDDDTGTENRDNQKNEADDLIGPLFSFGVLSGIPSDDFGYGFVAVHVLPKSGERQGKACLSDSTDLLNVGPLIDGAGLRVDVQGLFPGDVGKRVILMDTDDDTIGAEFSIGAIG